MNKIYLLLAPLQQVNGCFTAKDCDDDDDVDDNNDENNDDDDDDCSQEPGGSSCSCSEMLVSASVCCF